MTSEWNVLAFILVCWVVITALAWSCEYGPEIYREQKTIWLESHPAWKDGWRNALTHPEPVSDPEKTITLTKIRHELDIVFVIKPPSKTLAHRRHARV